MARSSNFISVLRNSRCLVTLPRILVRHILKELAVSSARMILITPGSVTPVLSKIVSNVVRSSQAIWMTAEISPGLKCAEDSIDLGMLIAADCG